MEAAAADIIVPVHNNLDCVRDCLESIEEGTSVPHQLWIVDDGSDSHTHRYLEEFTERHPTASLIVHDHPKGFVLSANEALEAGTQAYAVVLNSDVIVPVRWLERIIDAAQSDPSIAVVNPVSNFAANLSLPIAPGCTIDRMDQIVEQNSRRIFPDVVTCVGFCFFIVREHLKDIGLFDPVFGMGYCEDSDFCMRALSAGFRTIVADQVYVYHKGRSSFDNFEQRYLENRKIFDARWDNTYPAALDRFMRQRPLEYLREIFAFKKKRVLGVETRRYLVDAARHMRSGDPVRSAKAVKGATVSFKYDYLPALEEQYFDLVTDKDRMRVTYILPKLHTGGGVFSVVQLVNGLVRNGVDARIACVEPPDAIVDSWKLLSAPLIYKNSADLVRNFPPADIAVATMWTTASWVAQLVEERSGITPIYFVQDFEPWFYPDDPQLQKQAMESYDLIPNRIVKTQWLADKLHSHGFNSEKIRLGLNTAIFYPRDPDPHNPDRRIRIAMMARPETPQRGFDSAVQFMREFQRAYPNSVFVLFGTEQDLQHSLSGLHYESHGILDQGDALARLYSSADLFIDPSDFQGFGRPGLEAMACGTATILTNQGGVNEYATDGENTALVEPRQPEQWVEAASRLLRSPFLRGRYREQGLKTAAEFDLRLEVERTQKYFERLRSESLL